MNPSGLLTAVRTAAEHPETLEALRDILSLAEGEVLRLGIPCRACGNCCDFDAKDHRLFVSTSELALLASVHPSRQPVKLQCPYQQENLCTARDRRPLGCRLYYCNHSMKKKLCDMYEEYHHRIIGIHRDAGLPYAYAEMTAWLEAYLVEF